MFQLTRYISLLFISEKFSVVGFFDFVLQGTISNLLFLTLPYLLIKLTIKKYSILIAIPLIISNIFYFTHLFFLKTPISLGAIAVVGETTPQEALEFIRMVGFKIIAGSIILALSPLLVFLLKMENQKNINFLEKISLYLFLPIYLIMNIGVNQNFSEKTLIPYYNSFVFNDLVQIRYYVREQHKLKKQINLRKNNKIGSVYRGTRKEQNVILIIGESMSKYHIPFYGYKRNTMPQLSKLKNELFVFSDVISPATQTRESILRMLTLAEGNNENLFYDKASILQAANEAGYKTSWISNQMMLGLSDTETSVIAKDSKYTKFINSDWNSNSLDEKLLPGFKERLRESSAKKMIVLHMLGNHFEYKKRYPEADNYFNEISTDFPVYYNDYHKKTINHYDNSIRYSDQFIFNVIDQVKQVGVPTVVIYLSDHGEELFDDENLYIGHGSPDLRKEAVDIPFFMWYSDHYNDEQLPINAIDNKYNTEDLFHTLADVMNLSFNEFDATKSIVSSKFIPQKRSVVNSNNKLIEYIDIK